MCIHLAFYGSHHLTAVPLLLKCPLRPCYNQQDNAIMSSWCLSSIHCLPPGARLFFVKIIVSVSVFYKFDKTKDSIEIWRVKIGRSFMCYVRFNTDDLYKSFKQISQTAHSQQRAWRKIMNNYGTERKRSIQHFFGALLTVKPCSCHLIMHLDV